MQGLGFGVEGLRGFGFRVQGFGFRVWAEAFQDLTLFEERPGL